MDDYFLKSRRKINLFINWRKAKNNLKRLFGKKQQNILWLAILTLIGLRLFFSVFLDDKAYAQKNISQPGINLKIFNPGQKIGKGIIKIPTSTANTKLCLSVGQVIRSSNQKTKEKIERYKEMITGYPMENMVPEIAKKNKRVAAFLIGIAKKESNWGKYSPKKNGRDCYNYWGYRGRYNPTKSGYSCFDNPQQAVSIVGGRIENLISQKINTPQKMIVWKCGSTCRGHNPQGVKKWISDVSFYFYRLNS